MSVYFGGSRSLRSFPQLAAVVRAVLSSGQAVHVGCQLGADALVIHQAILRGGVSSLVVFAVAPLLASAPVSVQSAARSGARVMFSAGGTSAPRPARYLLRSIAAFQGCSHAVFFNPGAGSLAVAREFIAHYQKRGIHPCNGIPVFAFSEQAPAPVPSVGGQWVASQFMGFACWQWQAPTQPALF